MLADKLVAWLTLAGLVAFGAVALVGRVALHLRRTGSSGVQWSPRGVVQWSASAGFVAGVSAGVLAPLAALGNAVFVFGLDRRATMTPFAGDAQADWPLRPWTAYVTATGEPIWTTDATALLGVSGGAASDLLAPLDSAPLNSLVWTGAGGNDWVTTSVDCAAWTNDGGIGTPQGAFADAGNVAEMVFRGNGICSASRYLYCAEL